MKDQIQDRASKHSFSNLSSKSDYTMMRQDLRTIRQIIKAVKTPNMKKIIDHIPTNSSTIIIKLS